MIQKLRANNEKGFTLIELMIVIAIIGILSAIAIPNFLSYQKKGYDASAKSEGNNFYSTALAYCGDKGQENDITLSGTALPSGFAANADVIYGGTFLVDTNGSTTSTMAFSHSKSSKTWSLSANGALTD